MLMQFLFMQPNVFFYNCFLPTSLLFIIYLIEYSPPINSTKY